MNDANREGEMQTMTLWFFPVENIDGKQAWANTGCCDEFGIAGPGCLDYSDARDVATLTCPFCKATFTMMEIESHA